MPKSVSVWHKQFLKEGMPEKKAIKEAIQRAFENDDITESQADDLEKKFKVASVETTMDSQRLASELVKLAKELVGNSGWLNDWRRGNDRGDGYEVGNEKDSPSRAARREGWTVVDTDVDAVLATKRNGKMVVIADSNGPWAVDVSDKWK